MSLLRDFLKLAPEGAEHALAALACAESLTDDIALAIYRQVPVPGIAAGDFVAAFKYSGLTQPRNSEWSLMPSLRQELVESPALSAADRQAVHGFLLSVGRNGDRQKAGSDIPSYLFTGAGAAYHLAGAGRVDQALEAYGDVSRGRVTGEQWLGARLAQEQERTGVIPAGRIETTFLRAWVMWHDGRKHEAMPLFQQVADTDLERREVAIALHILGNDNNQGARAEAERQLRRSIEIDTNRGDSFGAAQALHSLANLLTRQDRFKEAEQAYRKSLEIGERLPNPFHVAQALHSLANLYARRKRKTNAEEMYKRGIAIREGLEDLRGLAQTLHSFGVFLNDQKRYDEAEKVFRRSIEMDERGTNELGAAKARHSLANLMVSQGRLDEAEPLLRESIRTLEKRKDDFGVAQTLHSLGKLLAKQGRVEEAENAFQKSLSLRERHPSQQASVLTSYGTMLRFSDPQKAIALLRRALDLDRKLGKARYAGRVAELIRRIQRDKI